jgi:phage terminase large subunit-like protein
MFSLYKDRHMKRFIVLAAVVMMGTTSVATAKKYPLTADKSVPAARGQVDVGRDKNGNTKVEVEVEHLAAPENLTPPRTAYVVWFQERGSEPLNQGALRPNKSLNATFKTITPLKSFDVFVTAESDANSKSPSGTEVLRASVQP